MEPKFSVGDRVQTNKAYKDAARIRMKLPKRGEVVRVLHGRYRVLWDGNVTPATVHSTFLEKEREGD